MLRADSLEDVALHPVLNATQRITAEDIHVVCLGYLFSADNPWDTPVIFYSRIASRCGFYGA